MSRSESDDDEIAIYDPLRRNRKRKIIVTLSSSESEDDEDSDDNSPRRRSLQASNGKRRVAQNKRGGAVPDKRQHTAHARDPEEEDDSDVQFLPNATLANKVQEEIIQQEIEQQLAKDKVLSQAQAFMSKLNAVQNRVTSTASMSNVITLDLDSDSDPEVELNQSESVNCSPQKNQKTIRLKVRSNGDATSEITLPQNAPFALLYQMFCNLHGLPRKAVQMFLDGERLNLQSSPMTCDLEDDDLIDATVDFSLQDDCLKKSNKPGRNPSLSSHLIRLRLVVNKNPRPEIFKMDKYMQLEKLRTSFCTKHGITSSDDIQLSFHGELLQVVKTLDYYGIRDGATIDVTVPEDLAIAPPSSTATATISSRTDGSFATSSNHKTKVATTTAKPNKLSLRVRFLSLPQQPTEMHRVAATAKVETLVTKLATAQHVAPTKLSLVLDGETMNLQKTFVFYDLEGDELIDVKIW